jgi:hypothetical protein
MGRRFVDMRTVHRRMLGLDLKRQRETRRREEAADMDQQLAHPTTPTLPSPDVVSKVLLGGDLAQLTAQQKISYYRSVCESLGLNPLTKPFEYIRLSGREVLYATRNCTDQLRHRYNISVQITSREDVAGCYIVTARASFPDGRHDESIGAVPIETLKGEARSNALMKCETKAKRRVTLSLVGLSTLDESEVESIPGAQPVTSPDIPQELGSMPPVDPPASASRGTRDVPQQAPAVAGDVEAAAAPADHNADIPDTWKPFTLPPIEAAHLTGRVAKVDQESKKSAKGKVYTKSTITLDSGEMLTTLDRDLAAKCSLYQVNQWLAEFTVKDTRWGKDILTLQQIPEAGDDAAF